MLEAVENKGRFCATPIDIDDENGGPLPLVFVSVDSKSVGEAQGVSVDSSWVKVLCFVWEIRRFVSADSKGVKVVYFDTDSRGTGSVDSKRVSCDDPRGGWRRHGYLSLLPPQQHYNYSITVI